MTPGIVLELCALAGLLLQRPGRFCANFLNLSNFPVHVNRFSFNFDIRQRRSSRASNILLKPFGRPGNEAPRVGFVQRKTFKQRPASLEPLGLAGNVPGSCNGLFSEGFPTGVQG